MVGFSEPEYCPKHRAKHAKSYSRIACHHLDLVETAYGRELINQQVLATGAAHDLGVGGLGRFEREARQLVVGGSNDPVHKLDFPIAEKDAELLDALDRNQVVVLVGPTGSGKSTHVPRLLLRSKWSKIGSIVVTQPRIQATRSIPRFVARLNDSSYGPGAEIGFCHSNADEYDRRTRLLFMTDGKLIKDIVSGAVADYSIVFIDEAHERSVNIDLILGLLREQLYLYPQLRLVIASATINHDAFIGYFGGEERVGFIEGKGRSFPIRKHWWDAEENWCEQVNGGRLPRRPELPGAIADLVRWLCGPEPSRKPKRQEAEDGHILVFLPGTREIDKTVSLVNAMDIPGVLCLPLYAKRPLDEQARALDPTSKRDRKMRRVVVSTNVAETSLTVQGVRFVIDSGYVKESGWNPVLQVSELSTVLHSRQGCRQRWGRAGRVAEGDVYMLYTRDEFERDFPAETAPGMARASLEEVLLKAAAAGVRDLQQFPWMPLPDPLEQRRFRTELARARETLVQKGALDTNYQLTRFGLELAGVPTSVLVAGMLAAGDRFGLGIEIATLLPFLQLERGAAEIFEWDPEWSLATKVRARRLQLALTFGCRDDLDLYAKIWVLWASVGGGAGDASVDLAGLDLKTLESKIDEGRSRLLRTLMDWRKSERRPLDLRRLDSVRALAASCMPEQVYEPLGNGSSSLTGSCDAEDGYAEYEDDLELDRPPGQAPPLLEYRGGPNSPGTVLIGEASRVEMAPISMVARKRTDGCVLVGTRKANYLRPARARILGLNLLSIREEWVDLHERDIVEQALELSAPREPVLAGEHHNRLLRMFLPWIVPVGAHVEGKVVETLADGRWLDVTPPETPQPCPVEVDAVEVVAGWMPDDSSSPLPPGDCRVQLRVVDHLEHAKRGPVLVVEPAATDDDRFHSFARAFKVGDMVWVSVRRALDDLLGRAPIFVVRERSTGVEIPVPAADFCGGSRYVDDFAMRFMDGEAFQMHVMDICEEDGEVRLSRAWQLLDEYKRVPSDRHGRVMPTRVHRFDRASGAFLWLGQQDISYLAFVPAARCPPDLTGPGAVEALTRPMDRDCDPAALRKRLDDKGSLPEETCLGIEVDLLTPEAFRRFVDRYQVGARIEATVFRVLDRGNLLVDVGSGLKAVVYASELGLGDAGLLRAARSYSPADRVMVRVTSLDECRARISCSINRYPLLPGNLQPDWKGTAVVAHFSADSRDSDRFWVTVVIDGQTPAQVICQGRPAADVGEEVHVRIRRRTDSKGLIEAELIDGGEL